MEGSVLKGVSSEWPLAREFPTIHWAFRGIPSTSDPGCATAVWEISMNFSLLIEVLSQQSGKSSK